MTWAGDDERLHGKTNGERTVMPDPTPFGSYVDRYVSAGWIGVLPLPAREKKSPPTGYTGDAGEYPDVVALDDWRASRAAGNIGLRMAADVIGIDVDAYGDKPGAETFARLAVELGALPDTWCSTSRDDGISGIRFYRLAQPLKLIGSLPGIEIIQRHHRYAVVAPSIHPEGGREYRWIGPGGEVGDLVPEVDELPYLPDAWVEHLRADKRSTRDRQTLATGLEVAPAVERAYGAAMMGMTKGTRHDSTLRAVTALLRLERQEFPGATQAIRDLERAFLSAITADGTRSDREAQGEWDRMVESAGDEVASTPSIIPKWEPMAPAPDAEALGLTNLNPALAVPWAEPRQIPDREITPPFPIEALPGWMQEHVVAAADALQVPHDLTATLAIGALVAACTGRANVHVTPEWCEPVCLYLVSALPSGAGKSPAHAKVARWLDKWEAERIAAVQEAHDRAMLKVRHAKKKLSKLEGGMGEDSDLFAALDLVAAAEAEVPPLPKVLIDDVTPEAVAGLLAAHDQRLAITSTEADLFDMLLKGRTGQRQNVNIFLKAWSGDPFRRDRKGGSESGPESMTLTRPLMSASITVQPAVLARVAGDDEMASRGLTSRFMVSMPESWLGSRDRRRTFRAGKLATTGPYEAECRRLAERWSTWQHPADLHLDAEAARLVEDYLVEIEPQLAPGEPLEKLAEWANKVHASIVRYAGLLHLAEDRDPGAPVAGDLMARALLVGRYWMAHAHAVMGLTGDEVVKQAQAILSWAAANGARFSLRDAQTHVRRPGEGLDKIADYVPAIELLIDLEWLRPVDNGDWRANVGVRRAKSPEFAICPSVVGSSPSVVYARSARTAYRESAFALSPHTDTPTPSTPTRYAHYAHYATGEAPDPTPVDNPGTTPTDWMDL